MGGREGGREGGRRRCCGGSDMMNGMDGEEGGEVCLLAVLVNGGDVDVSNASPLFPLPPSRPLIGNGR